MNGYNTYIGARYVPIVMGNWNAETAYEPLSIVMYEGNSYTSRTFVPAGTPVSNETYWALTGNYNAQIEQYRQEVAALQDDVGANTSSITEINNNLSSYDTRITNNANNITTLQGSLDTTNSNLNTTNSNVSVLEGRVTTNANDITTLESYTLQGKEVHFFGDSLTFGTGGTKPYPTVFGEITGATVVNHAVSGAQVTQNNQPENLQLITQITQANLSNADYCFIEIGANDYFRQTGIGTMDSSTYFFIGGYKNCITTLLNKTPAKCKVVLMTIFPNQKNFDYISENQTILENYNRAIVELGEFYNIQVVDCTTTLGVNKLNFSKLSSDGVHFNDTGYNLIANSLAKFLYATNSFNNIRLSKNMVGNNDFKNNSDISGYFNGTPNNGVFLALNSQGDSVYVNTGASKYYFKEGEFYTVSCDIYSTLDNPVVGVNIWNTVDVSLLNDPSSPSTRTDFCIFSNVEQGVHHYKKTVRCPISGYYGLQIERHTNKEGTIGNVGITNFAITTGFDEYIPPVHNVNGIKSTDFGPNVVADDIGGIWFNAKNGNYRINGGFTTQAQLNTNAPILNSIPNFGTGAGTNSGNGILFGYDLTDNSIVPFALQGGKLVCKKQIESGHTVRIAYVIPASF